MKIVNYPLDIDVEKRLATRSPDLAVAQILNMLIISYNAMNDLTIVKFTNKISGMVIKHHF